MKMPSKMKPVYGISALVQALPIITSQLIPAPAVPFDSGHAIILLIMWSLPASFLAGAIVGAREVRRLGQLFRGLIPLAFVMIGLVGFQILVGVGEVSLYVVMVWGAIQGPAAILGAALGAFLLSKAAQSTS